MDSSRDDLIPPATVQALAETFRALGDATRVRILDALSRSERCVGDVADLLGVSESAVSHQLRILRNLRLVRARRVGRLVFYALDDQHVVRLFAQGLEHVEERRTMPVEGARLGDTAASARCSRSSGERVARSGGEHVGLGPGNE